MVLWTCAATTLPSYSSIVAVARMSIKKLSVTAPAIVCRDILRLMEIAELSVVSIVAISTSRLRSTFNRSQQVTVDIQSVSILF